MPTSWSINPFMFIGFFYINSLNQSLSNGKEVCFIEIPVLNANRADPDQIHILQDLIWIYMFSNVPFMGHEA